MGVRIGVVTALCDAIDHWGTTPEERRRHYPCDDLLPADARALFRSVTVAAPPSVVFRWLCQLKVAPYSYDLIDNLGRRSPRRLVSGVDDLVVGQPVMIFELTSFRRNEHLTIQVRHHPVFGDVAISYTVTPGDLDATSRLVVKVVTVPARGMVGAVMRPLLPAGDLVMMRRQLLNFKTLAESTAAELSDATGL